MKKISTLLLLLVSFTKLCKAQQWQAIHENHYSADTSTILKHLSNSTRYQLHRNKLFQQQLRTCSTLPEAGLIAQLPTPDGGSKTFRIWETPVMHPDLAIKFPELKQYTAEDLAAPWITAKINLDTKGFHAMVFNGENTYFIEPATNSDDGQYLAFYKRNIIGLSKPSCEVRELPEPQNILPSNTAQLRTNGANRKTYRLALAATGEYTAFHGGTVALAMAAITTSINRVNGVYERELSVSMTLVANNYVLVYTNGSTDPYTNNNGGTMLGQNISNVNAVIGSANYDIGHVFSTGGGGIAYLGCVCTANKAGGVTGSSSPIGDAFDIDYVAHEMGHQFGGDHTFNGTTSSCSGGNRTASSAYEPGSGSTIQAYAGICGAENLQPHSDPYFHARSLQQMADFITTGSGNSCAVTTASTNVPNTLPSFQQTYNIPYKTPFELTAPLATDNTTSEPITYCWEEYDLGNAAPANDDIAAERPILRSFNPDTSRTRVFPRINKVMGNQLYTLGETLPQRARTMYFILTTRDFYQGWGAFHSTYNTDSIILNVQNTGASVFDVTSQSTATNWTEYTTQTVTWNVAGTTAAPISAATVDIYMSLDSGKSFPYLLASAVPNNGSATVTAPGVSGSNNTKGRVKVKATNNVFFQVNKANITIVNNPLHIDLQSFEVSEDGCVTTFNWYLPATDKVQLFELQYSSNGKDYASLTTITAEDLRTVYQYRMPSLKGKNYYRLLIKEKNNEVSYSEVKQLQSNCTPTLAFDLYPNPASEQVYITGSQNIAALVVYNAAGQVMYKESGFKSPSATISIGQWASGVYWFNVLANNGTLSKHKLVKP